MTSGATGRKPVLDFPCEFPVKVFGESTQAFEPAVLEIFRRHVPGLDESRIRRRPSRHGRYVSITVTLRAESRCQLDDLYRELSAQRRVLMAL
ncbi:MAG TPA: DUF493 domain-containing protein [Gammaproteobacteria bacterium]|nr:DUF493 domain-containing protein [Gammaproteobacteria bacterium]